MHKRDSMRARALAVAAASACFGLAAPGAFAQAQAYTSEPVDLYAGPSGDYPVVTELGPNVPVTVMGCVSDYSWCDVALPDLRGWIYGAYLAYPYQGGYVPVEGYGAAIGLPIVTFSLGAYWGSFYRDRPWYGDRERWAHGPGPGYGGRPSGPPPMHGGLPPGAGHPSPAYGAGRPPTAAMPGNERQPAGNMAHPPAPGGGRPSGPAPQYEGRGQPQPQGYAHGPGMSPGTEHGPAFAPGNARPEGRPEGRQEGRQEGGHSEGQGGGNRGESRPQN